MTGVHIVCYTVLKPTGRSEIDLQEGHNANSQRKKPFTVLVGIILVLVLGVVAFTKMTTDLLPNMDLPYMVVYATDPGASPESVEGK